MCLNNGFWIYGYKYIFTQMRYNLVVAESVCLRIFGSVKHGDNTFLTKFQPKTRAYTVI